MARESRTAGARMRTGICLQDDCELAKTKEKQTIRMGHDFVCKECGAELHEVKVKPIGPNWKLIGGIAAAVLVLGGGGAAAFLMGGAPEVQSVMLDKNLAEGVEGSTTTLVSTVLPADAPHTLVWESADTTVAKVNGGVVNMIAGGETVVTVSVKEQPTVKAVCKISVKKKEPVQTGTNIEKIAFVQSAITMEEGSVQIVELSIEPVEADEALRYTSSDERVARVDGDELKALMAGRTVITVESERSGAKAMLDVTVQKINNEGGGKSPDGVVVTKDLGYAVYKGKLKNGKMHDDNGVLTFKQKHVIESRDVKQRMAQPGERVVGIFENGHLTTGTWHKNDGNKETIIP